MRHKESGRDRTLEGNAHLQHLLEGSRALALYLCLVSGVINALALTGSVYMLQVYDRVLVSGSVPTLIAISILAVVLYAFQGLFELLRSQIFVRVGAVLDHRTSADVHRVAIDLPRLGFSTAEALERGRHVDVVRGFLGGSAPIALFDLPWVPLFLVFVFLLHPLLGTMALGGAMLLAAIAVATEILSRKLQLQSQQAAITRGEIADSNARNSEVIHAMGFADAAVTRYSEASERHLTLQTRTNDICGTLGSIAKVLRMILQSAVLGLGAYLSIIGEMTAGTIVAASIASSRALTPIDMVISNWKVIIGAHSSWQKLVDTVRARSRMREPSGLPAPTHSLKVENLTVAAPSTGRVILSEVNFELKAGQALGIIGSSGGGKSTLLRAIAGIWPPLRGSVRLDGADISQWSADFVRKSFGYLPQDHMMFDTTVALNIARLEKPDPELLLESAKTAGVHELILQLPQGYDAQLGPAGNSLSGGQRQRIGLARALYGKPFLVLLDEPNSNLDAAGEASVSSAISSVKKRGGIVIVVAHRPSALQAVDFIAVVQNGRMVSYGPRETILKVKPAISNPTANPSASPASAVGS